MLSKCFNIRKGIGEEPVILILLFFNAMMDNCTRNLFSDVRDALIEHMNVKWTGCFVVH